MMAMKELKYAFSVAIPVITALLLLSLAMIVADVISHFYSTNASGIIISTILAQPENGIWAISGALFGAISSFTLLVIWDSYKDNKYTKKLDTAIINSIKRELINSSMSVQVCTEHLQRELECINATPQATLTAPPPVIKLEPWELLNTHIPSSISSYENLLSDLRSATNLISYFNNQLDSREQYHIHCKTNDNYYEQMGIYDTHLLNSLPEISNDIVSLTNSFNSIKL